MSLDDSTIPVHNKKRLEVNSPKELEQRLEEYPLNKDFIDWVVNLGYTISYVDMIPQGGTSFYTREIFIREHQKPPVTQDFVLMHELIHIAVPTLNKRHEYAIDRVAARLMKNEELIEYIKKTIKIQTS